MNVKSLFEENNLTTEPSSPVRGDFGTFLAKSTKEPKATVFAKTGFEAENRRKKKKENSLLTKVRKSGIIKCN